MKTVRVTIDAASAGGLTLGRIEPARVDATTEESIAAQRAADESEARLDAARYARRVRTRLGFRQVEFARRIDVSVETIRNWEQGTRSPAGAAKALFKALDKAPELALAALELNHGFQIGNDRYLGASSEPGGGNPVLRPHSEDSAMAMKRDSPSSRTAGIRTYPAEARAGCRQHNPAQMRFPE